MPAKNWSNTQIVSNFIILISISFVTLKVVKKKKEFLVSARLLENK